MNKKSIEQIQGILTEMVRMRNCFPKAKIYFDIEIDAIVIAFSCQKGYE